ncbi:774_t:CDS:2 [Paraglomus brasilianum]|uniref:774_t:CDS:1 n=1 Tax=Paraglomus brasilianum TaxID=144538 RepID=A0A9N8ZEL7_9GLOM|nr:774_t:CDS:2 [Paraglomus brasilianum]
MSTLTLLKEVLFHATLVIDYISYYINYILCLVFHYIFNEPPPFPIEKPTPTYHPAVLVTGTSTGIGQNAAITLARMGYTVFATVRKQVDADDLTHLFQQYVNTNQGNLIPIIMDVTDKGDIQKAQNIVRNVLGRDKPLVGLINNAAQAKHLQAELTSDATFREIFETNFFAVANLTKAFLPMLREGRGRVINIGSIASWEATISMGAYSSSKAALRALTKVWRMELRRLGVFVSLIEPGMIDTRLTHETNQNFLDLNLFRETPRHINPAVIVHYKEQYRTAGKYSNEFIDTIPPPALVTDAIVNALTAKYPKTTYYVGLDAKALAMISWLLGERGTEALQGLILGF